MAFATRAGIFGFFNGHAISQHDATGITTAVGPGGVDTIVVAADSAVALEVRSFFGEGTASGATVTFYSDDPGASGVAVSNPIELNDAFSAGVGIGVIARTVKGEALWIKTIGTGTLNLSIKTSADTKP